MSGYCIRFSFIKGLLLFQVFEKKKEKNKELSTFKTKTSQRKVSLCQQEIVLFFILLCYKINEMTGELHQLFLKFTYVDTQILNFLQFGIKLYFMKYLGPIFFTWLKFKQEKDKITDFRISSFVKTMQSTHTQNKFFLRL